MAISVKFNTYILNDNIFIDKITFGNIHNILVKKYIFGKKKSYASGAFSCDIQNKIFWICFIIVTKDCKKLSLNISEVEVWYARSLHYPKQDTINI